MRTFGDDELDFEFDNTGVTEEDAKPGGGKFCDKPGEYHVFIKGVKKGGDDEARPLDQIDRCRSRPATRPRRR